MLLLVFVALAACGGESTTAITPSMANHTFTPERIVISVGEAVRWVNDTDEAYTVTAEQESIPAGADYFSSGDAANETAALDFLSDQLIDPGEVYEWTFEWPGTYRYYCIPHRGDGMEGTIVVEE